MFHYLDCIAIRDIQEEQKRREQEERNKHKKK